MIPILDWIFEGIVGWVSSIASKLLDAVSGLFLEALGTDMTAMEEYFPFVTKAYGVMQVTAYAILILIVLWQLFRAFGGPITEAENPWHLLIRGAMFAFFIGYAKPIFSACLTIARAPYTSLMDLTITGEDFTFAGIEQALSSGLITIVALSSVVGLILILILEIALGWNYFKLLLETVERYIVVGVLCYTSPLAFSMGASKSTNNVFRSWCRMVGSQLLLLIMNVWFLRGFASSMGRFIGNGGALTTGKGSIFLWMFCALAYLKCAQRFDSYLASMGLNVAQTGSSMGMELLMAARVVSGIGSGAKSAGNVFGRAGSGTVASGAGAAAGGLTGFASRFNPNSYVRDAVVEGGDRMGFSGGAGFVGRALGGMAARNGATLNGQSISSVASRMPGVSGAIAGEIADRSLSNYMPHMQDFQMKGTQIKGGHISTTATTPDGKKSNVDMYSASQFEKPDTPHSVVTASDGSQWYQIASGEGRGVFYDAPVFDGIDAQLNAGGINTDSVNPQTGEASYGAEAPGLHRNGERLSDSVVLGAEEKSQGVGDFSAILTQDTPYMPEVGAAFEPGNDVLRQMPTFTGDVVDMPTLGDISNVTVENTGGIPGQVSSFADSNLGGVDIQTESDVAPGNTVMPVSHDAGYEAPEFGAGVSGGFHGADHSAGTNGDSFHGGDQHNGHPAQGDDSPGYSGGFSHGGYAEAPLVAATFPSAQEGTMLRTVGDGVIEASSPDGGNTLWYNSAYYQEPDAPHSVMEAANGVQWYAMQQQAHAPQFESGAEAAQYNQAAFQNFMPGYEGQVAHVDGTHRLDGHFEVRNADGSGTAFYDTARYAAPRGDYQVLEDARGSQWYAIRGEAAVDRKPVYENGQAVYDDGKLRTVSVETVRYKQTPARFAEPQKRGDIDRKPPRRKQ